MNYNRPDPEYYKGPYANQWARHAKNVTALREQLVSRFPSLRHSITTGLGAESSELIQVPPHEKGSLILMCTTITSFFVISKFPGVQAKMLEFRLSQFISARTS